MSTRNGHSLSYFSEGWGDITTNSGLLLKFSETAKLFHTLFFPFQPLALIWGIALVRGIAVEPLSFGDTFKCNSAPTSNDPI